MADEGAPSAAPDAAPTTTDAADAAGMDVDIFGDAGADDDLGEEIARAGADEIAQRTRMLENEIKVLKNETMRLQHDQQSNKERIKENTEKIKLNKQLPYLVANVVELLEQDPNDEPEEDGGNIDLDAHRKGKCCVIKTSTRQTIFLPVPGLVATEEMKPADLVGVNKDSYLILEKLPEEFDSRVKAMEVDEKPTEEFNDVGGLNDQIQELVEAIVLPMTHKERFTNIGIKPPKGCLMYGPPGTGKTLSARAVANRTDACFIRVIGSELVQKYVGEGARLVRELFQMARSKKACLIFFDEVDAIGGARFDDGQGGDNEVQRTMLEIVNQLDGFDARGNIKVLMATNRPDTLDPALLRPGRLDRKVEFGLPDLESRTQILRIHTRSMAVERDIRYELLSRLCPNATGAELHSVCTEAGMFAIRQRRKTVNEKDFLDAIAKVIKGYQKFSSTAKYMQYQ